MGNLQVKVENFKDGCKVHFCRDVHVAALIQFVTHSGTIARFNSRSSIRLPEFLHLFCLQLSEKYLFPGGCYTLLKLIDNSVSGFYIVRGSTLGPCVRRPDGKAGVATNKYA